MTITPKGQLLPVKSFTEAAERNIVGVWVSGEVSDDLRNPVVWAACARLIMCEQGFHQRVKSPSSDRNTFMLCVINGSNGSYEGDYEDSMGHKIKSFEFKVVQNQVKKGVQKPYNSWVVIHSKKNLTLKDHQIR